MEANTYIKMIILKYSHIKSGKFNLFQKNIYSETSGIFETNEIKFTAAEPESCL